jgi:hypothetical protein
VTSPTGRFSATSRSSRRMILPDRDSHRGVHGDDQRREHEA